MAFFGEFETAAESATSLLCMGLFSMFLI